MKEGREFVLQIESGSRFHSLGADKWNAREPIAVLNRDSANRRVPDDRRQRGGCKDLAERAYTCR